MSNNGDKISNLFDVATTQDMKFILLKFKSTLADSTLESLTDDAIEFLDKTKTRGGCHENLTERSIQRFGVSGSINPLNSEIDGFGVSSIACTRNFNSMVFKGGGEEPKSGSVLKGVEGNPLEIDSNGNRLKGFSGEFSGNNPGSSMYISNITSVLNSEIERFGQLFDNKNSCNHSGNLQKPSCCENWMEMDKAIFPGMNFGNKNSEEETTVSSMCAERQKEFLFIFDKKCNLNLPIEICVCDRNEDSESVRKKEDTFKSTNTFELLPDFDLDVYMKLNPNIGNYNNRELADSNIATSNNRGLDSTNIVSYKNRADLNIINRGLDGSNIVNHSNKKLDGQNLISMSFSGTRDSKDRQESSGGIKDFLLPVNFNENEIEKSGDEMGMTNIPKVVRNSKGKCNPDVKGENLCVHINDTCENRLRETVEKVKSDDGEDQEKEVNIVKKQRGGRKVKGSKKNKIQENKEERVRRNKENRVNENEEVIDNRKDELDIIYKENKETIPSRKYEFELIESDILKEIRNEEINENNECQNQEANRPVNKNNGEIIRDFEGIEENTVINLKLQQKNIESTEILGKKKVPKKTNQRQGVKANRGKRKQPETTELIDVNLTENMEINEDFVRDKNENVTNEIKNVTIEKQIEDLVKQQENENVMDNSRKVQNIELNDIKKAEVDSFKRNRNDKVSSLSGDQENLNGDEKIEALNSEEKNKSCKGNKLPENLHEGLHKANDLKKGQKKKPTINNTLRGRTRSGKEVNESTVNNKHELKTKNNERNIIQSDIEEDNKRSLRKNRSISNEKRKDGTELVNLLNMSLKELSQLSFVEKKKSKKLKSKNKQRNIVSGTTDTTEGVREMRRNVQSGTIKATKGVKKKGRIVKGGTKETIEGIEEMERIAQIGTTERTEGIEELGRIVQSGTTEGIEEMERNMPNGTIKATKGVKKKGSGTTETTEGIGEMGGSGTLKATRGVKKKGRIVQNGTTEGVKETTEGIEEMGRVAQSGTTETTKEIGEMGRNMVSETIKATKGIKKKGRIVGSVRTGTIEGIEEMGRILQSGTETTETIEEMGRIVQNGTTEGLKEMGKIVESGTTETTEGIEETGRNLRRSKRVLDQHKKANTGIKLIKKPVNKKNTSKLINTLNKSKIEDKQLHKFINETLTKLYTQDEPKDLEAKLGNESIYKEENLNCFPDKEADTSLCRRNKLLKIIDKIYPKKLEKKRPASDSFVNDIVFVKPSSSRRNTVFPSVMLSNTQTSSKISQSSAEGSNNIMQPKDFLKIVSGKAKKMCTSTPIKKLSRESVNPSKVQKKKRKNNTELFNMEISTVEQPSTSSNGVGKRRMFTMEKYMNSLEFLKQDHLQE